MKTIFAILLFTSMNSWACMTIRPTNIGDGVVEAQLSAIIAPLFSGFIDTEKDLAIVKAIVELSTEGTIVSVIKIDIKPSYLPKAQIEDSIMKAKFLPRTKDKVPVPVKDFEFVWEFEIQSMPKHTLTLDL
jgi:hypothetical protein